LTSRAAEGLRRRGYDIVSPFGDGERSGNLSFCHPRLAIEDLEGRLRSAGIDLAIRGGKLRISPSYYNDTQEIDRLLDVLPSA